MSSLSRLRGAGERDRIGASYIGLLACIGGVVDLAGKAADEDGPETRESEVLIRRHLQ
jgi:hypothetical protein